MQKIIAIISTTLLSIVMLLTSIGSASAMPQNPPCSSARLFVGNLPWETTDEGLRDFFGENVVEAKIIIDRYSGRSRGFGFVTFPDIEYATAALEALDGAEFMGRKIRVDCASSERR